MKRTANCQEEEPKQSLYELPSEKEHSFNVVDVNPDENDVDIVYVQLEVSSGDESGRRIRNRINLNDQSKSFFATRLFLKAIGEPYKGVIDIDSDNWFGRSFVASVKHTTTTKTGNDGVEKTRTFANIDKYNFNSEAVVATNKQPTEVPGAPAWEE